MKQDWKRFAPIGLAVGVLASITATAGYFVFGNFTLLVQISISLAVLGFAIYILLAPQQLLGALTGRQARFGSNALLMVIGVFGILAVVNYLAAQYPQQWDVTENDANTLASETLDILGALPDPVHILAFYAGPPPQNLIKLFGTFAAESNNQITFEFMDPEIYPMQAKSLGVTHDRTIVLIMDERVELLDVVFGEQELSAGLVRLMSETRNVYFLTGHGEKSVTDPQSGYGTVLEYILAKGYNLGAFSLLTSTSIPQDADVLVIAGPLNLYSLAEVEMLAAYMDAGGSMIVFLEPTVLTNVGSEEDLLSSYLLASWGIIVGNDMIVDLRTEGFSNAVSDDYPTAHPVVSKLETLYTVFPTARSVQVGEPIQGISKVVLAQTAPFDASWAETDLLTWEQENFVEPNEGVDFFGPVPVAVAAENTKTDARLIVVGDSEFLDEQMITQFPANAEFFFNAVDWTAGQENLLNLTPREQTQRFISMPFDYFDAFAALILIFLIPGAFVVSGVLVWRQRRRRL